MKTSKVHKEIKKRNWWFVLYPESAPEDWREQLKLSGLQVAVSPLHDKDLDPDGKPKKAHYHIILVYGNSTTYNNVKNFTNGKLGQTIPQGLEQVRGAYRYLTHKDNPEKYQYDEKEIVTFNGFNILDFSELTRSEIHRIKMTIQTYIRENDIFEYCDLMDDLQDAELIEQHEIASNNTFFFQGYIHSRRNKLKSK